MKREDTTRGGCGTRDAIDTAAYLAGELGDEERRDADAHLLQCRACREALDAMRQVRSMLAALPGATVQRDLAPLLLARLDAESAQGTGTVVPFWPRLVRIAATVVLAVGGLTYGVWMLRARPGAVPAAGAEASSPMRQAAEWLCRTQEPDGSWSTARWGGSRHYEVALTGLSVLSLLEAEATVAPERMKAIGRAEDYLRGSQDGQGEFGPKFGGAPYNQSMATLALLRVYREHPRAELKRALDAAVAAIVSQQLRDGGWGYAGEAAPASNLSITLWQVEALRLAAVSGWDSARVPAARGLRWIAAVASDDGSFGYRRSGDFPEGARTLTAMGAMSLLDVAEGQLVPDARRAAIKARVQRLASAGQPDLDYYGRYFLSAALKRMGEESARQQLTDMRTALAAAQVRRGPERGSWNADDRWSTAGGRVYATAMASLSMR